MVVEMQTLISTARQITGIGAFSRDPKRMLTPIVRDPAGYERLLVLRNYESLAIILNLDYYESLLRSIGQLAPNYVETSVTDIQRRSKEILDMVNDQSCTVCVSIDPATKAVIVNVASFEKILDRLEQKQ
jgi:PHD/YefM family antitoxin component YafN of YafNO toxin-antitoxin module